MHFIAGYNVNKLDTVYRIFYTILLHFFEVYLRAIANIIK